MTEGDGIISQRSADPLELAWLELSDLGNAQRLLARYGDRLSFHPSTGWLAYDGRVWSREQGEALAHQWAHEAASAIRSEAEALETEIDRRAQKGISGAEKERLEKRVKELRRWAVQSGNSGRTAAMLAQAQYYLQRAPEAFDADPLRIAVQNGVLEIRQEIGDVVSVRRRDHDPTYGITRIAAVDYDPEATCPTWEAHLARCLPDAEIRAFLQRALGYSISGLMREQCFVVLQGPGQDGKSTTMNVVRRVMGGYAATADVRTFLEAGARGGADASPDLARLAGDVRLVSTSEPSRGSKLNEGLLKSLTGGAPIVARHLNREFFEFRPRFKVWLECNSRPIIRGDDEGIWRRVLLIQFPHRIPDDQVDRTLEDRLVEAEGPGILNWLLRGLEAYLLDGLRRPQAVEAAVADYKATSNPFGEWLAERCVREPGSRTLAKDLYQDYERWCAAQGLGTMKQTSFGRALGDHQFPVVRGTGGKKYRLHIRLLPPPDDLYVDDDRYLQK